MLASLSPSFAFRSLVQKGDKRKKKEIQACQVDDKEGERSQGQGLPRIETTSTAICKFSSVSESNFRKNKSTKTQLAKKGHRRLAYSFPAVNFISCIRTKKADRNNEPKRRTISIEIIFLRALSSKKEKNKMPMQTGKACTTHISTRSTLIPHGSVASSNAFWKRRGKERMTNLGAQKCSFNSNFTASECKWRSAFQRASWHDIAMAVNDFLFSYASP